MNQVKSDLRSWKKKPYTANRSLEESSRRINKILTHLQIPLFFYLLGGKTLKISKTLLSFNIRKQNITKQQQYAIKNTHLTSPTRPFLQLHVSHSYGKRKQLNCTSITKSTNSAKGQEKNPKRFSFTETVSSLKRKRTKTRTVIQILKINESFSSQPNPSKNLPIQKVPSQTNRRGMAEH